MRKTSLALIAVSIAFSAAPSFARCSFDETLNNSGEEQLVCVDTNQDGEIDPDNDCCLTGGVTVSAPATTSATSSLPLCLNAEQSDDSDQLQIMGCGERSTYTGNASPTSVTLTNQFGEGVPGFNGLSVEGRDGNSNSTTFGNGIPHVTQALVGIPGGSLIGQGQLCEAGGPAMEVIDNGGMTYVVRLVSLLSDGTRYLCAKAPLELTDYSTEMFDICWPVNSSGNSVIQTVNGEVTDTTLLPFVNGLPACAGNRMAPTASELGLIGLALALLVGGTWLLRRSSFGANLPTA